jgi:hypothetical protein
MCRNSADRALATWVAAQSETDLRNYPARWVESFIAPCREACLYADRVAAFAARARAGEVAPDVLATAVAAIRELMR